MSGAGQGGTAGGTGGAGGAGGSGGAGAGGTGATGGIGGAAATACVPGDQKACACGGGVEGFQICLKDGSGYDVCWCPATDCVTANNGVCDEPGFCADGTDGFDCCFWANDGVCDEPGLCDLGTDGIDCPVTVADDSCGYSNDGACQYPGVAACAINTDLTDCIGSCDDSCGMVDGICDEPDIGSSDGLCARGTDCTDCFGDTCSAAFDFKCDEDICLVGTDFTDCGY